MRSFLPTLKKRPRLGDDFIQPWGFLRTGDLTMKEVYGSLAVGIKIRPNPQGLPTRPHNIHKTTHCVLEQLTSPDNGMSHQQVPRKVFASRLYL